MRSLTRCVLCVAVLALAGCGTARNEVRGGETRIKHTTVEEFDPAQPDKVLRRESSAEASSTGPSQRQSGTEIDAAIGGQPAELHLPGGGSAKGGGFKASAEVLGGIPIIPILAGLAAIACIGGGFYLVRIGNVKSAVYAFGAGGAFIALAVFPEFVAAACLVAGAGVVLWIWQSRTAVQKQEGGRAYVEALVAKHGRDAARRMVEKYADRKSDLDLFDRIVREDDLRKDDE